uniref:Si:dkey-19b23.7 n=1 Tax=Poecilia latipinna TaxID=48699 RepID=A0A3B3TNF9_9TELE
MSCKCKRRRLLNKRKLQHFLNDLALLGSLQGFKYFQPWLRGKEELLLTVVNEDLVTWAAGAAPPCPGSLGARQTSRRLTLTPGRRLHTHTFRSVSPVRLTLELLLRQEVNCTLFLLAGYVKYGRPYAWIRSNHERLVSIGGMDSMVKDTPMKLKSITDWQTRGIRVWDIVSELVCLCTVPSPTNPLTLDMRYIKTLPLHDRFLVTGALLSFLETYLIYGNRDELHYDKVVEEVKPLRRLHFQALLELQRLRESPEKPTGSTRLDSSR